MIVSHISNRVTYHTKKSNFNNILFIFYIGYCLCFNCLFRFLDSLIKCTQFDLVLGFAKDGATHSESFAISRTPNMTKSSTPCLNIYFCTFDTGYGSDRVGKSLSFHLNYSGSILQVPSVPSKKYSFFVIVVEIRYVVLLSDVNIGFT